MTRPGPSALVLDGSEVKLRLVAERAESRSVVHVDWLRFTVIRRNAPFVPVRHQFPHANEVSIWDEDYRAHRLGAVLRSIPDGDFEPTAQALELAQAAARCLGADFGVAPEVRKGHDFYRSRWSIERHGAEVGWVGFGASGDSPRQHAQANTLHCNLWGSACTFAEHGWTERIAALVDERQGDLTRVDLALDFFDGLPGGMLGVKDQYLAGLMHVGGRKLKCNMLGDWANGHERSFYFGSKEAGKETNVYEKGDQLFGVEAGSPWVRVELRYGNKLRVLPSDILRRPADFFKGASDWHSLTLELLDAEVTAERVRTRPRLALETIEAEVTRNVRWTMDTAASSVAALFAFGTEESFLEIVSNKKLPARLRKFAPSELRRAFADAWQRVSSVGVTGPVPA